MHTALVLVLTVLLPGTGHLLLRRYLKGVVLAVLFAAAADAVLTSRLLWPGGASRGLAWASLGIMAGIWAYALYDVVARLKTLRDNDFQKKKDDMLKAAQTAWLRDEYGEAERLLKGILRLDERDLEAWVHLGKMLKSIGREEEARKCLRSALNLDGSEVWRWELMRELGYTDIQASEAETS